MIRESDGVGELITPGSSGGGGGSGGTVSESLDNGAGEGDIGDVEALSGTADVVRELVFL